MIHKKDKTKEPTRIPIEAIACLRGFRWTNRTEDFEESLPDLHLLNFMPVMKHPQSGVDHGNESDVAEYYRESVYEAINGDHLNKAHQQHCLYVLDGKNPVH